LLAQFVRAEHGFDPVPAAFRIEVRGEWVHDAQKDVDWIARQWDRVGVVSGARGPEALAEVRLGELVVGQRLTGPHDSLLLAWTLADMMRGDEAGLAPDVARAAAALYSHLALPSEPLKVMLSHPSAPTFAKVLSLRALAAMRSYDAETGTAMRTVVCALVAKVDGLENMAGLRAQSLHAVLTWDEIELVLALAMSAATLVADPPPVIKYLTSGMPDRNPVIVALRRNVH
jgi:hypothetical protein